LYFSLSLVNMFSLCERCKSISTPTPANIPFHSVLQQDSANPAALRY
jgi:hypothetical protein